jgi:crossover junction endonuclease MUS81
MSSNKNIHKNIHKNINKNINLVIDNRESKLITYLETQKEIPFEKKQLLLGDIQIFVNKNENNITPFIDYVIERKTIKDLLASVKDGRYKEQKGRILSQIEQKNVGVFFYIIEGSSHYLKSYEKSIYQGALISISLRDNIHIIKTDTPYDTGDFLVRLYKRLIKEDLSGKIQDIQDIQNIRRNNNETQPIKYIETLKASKKANIDAPTSQIMALGVVPGISYKIATAILKEYNTLSDLFDAYQGLETEEEKIYLLKNIEITENRKLGLSASKNIYEYLFS